MSTDLVEQLLAQRPKSLVFTVDGAAREPVFPPLIRAELHDGVWRCTIDTGRAAPDELDRALSRALPQLDVAGAKVDVVARPEPIPLRTQQLLAERLAALHAARVRVLDDVGVVYLLPRLFRFASLESGEVEVSVAAADRDTEQLARDAALELRGAPFGPGTTVRLVGSDDPALVRALAAHGVRRVTLAGDPPVQLHPRLFREVQCEGEERTVSAAPEADDRTVLTQVDYELPGVMERLGDVSGVAIDLVWSAADPTDRARARVVDRLIAAGPAKVRLVDGRGRRKQIFPEVIRRHVEVLGRRTTSALPMLLLGVDTEEADEVMAKLDAMADQLRGQRILLVFRDDALREVALPADHPLQCAVLERLGEIATAVLVFRPEVVIPACFEVVATRQDDLPLGQRLRDPRR
ncbi:MAG: hypothetical protein KDC87_01825 [Planctomycetes bacterium]|nr:hypothetical protein [Planctomycetota bacterium]